MNPRMTDTPGLGDPQGLGRVLSSLNPAGPPRELGGGRATAIGGDLDPLIGPSGEKGWDTRLWGLGCAGS